MTFRLVIIEFSITLCALEPQIRELVSEVTIGGVCSFLFSAGRTVFTFGNAFRTVQSFASFTLFRVPNNV